MSFIWRYCCFLALWLAATDSIAQQDDASLYDPDNADNWYQVEVVVFLNSFKTIDPAADGNGNGNKEALWHKKTRLLPTMTRTLMPIKGIERRPQTLGELNALMYSSEYAPDVRIIPVDSTVELEDVIVLLENIKPLHDDADSLAAIADPDSLGQYWPYIKPLDISGSLLDQAVFDNLNFQAEEKEPVFESEDEPIIRVSADKAFRRLPDAKLKLLKAAQRIKKSANYRLLTHQSWYQPVPPRGNGLPILLGIAGKDSSGSKANTFLTGTIAVERGRFLHAHADLQYILPVENEKLNDANTRPSSTIYMKLDTRVRMRSNEVHYLDHPHLNAFIVLTPYQPEEAEDPEQ